MKGIDKLREKLPDYQGKRIYWLISATPLIFLFSIGFQLLLDSSPRLFPDIIILQILAPFMPILGSLIVLTVGLIIVYNIWRVREKNLNKYQERAYQKSFKFIVIGIPMVISVIIHTFFPTDFIKSYQDRNSISWYLANGFINFFDTFSEIFFYLRLILFFFFLFLGMAVINRALKIFGIDYMGLVYLYYPQESKLQNHEIYSVLRHPTYHTLMLWSIGSLFLRCSIYSIAFFLIFMIGINIHLKYVEEKELIERFGDSYRKYKKEVPAFFVKWRDLKKYFKFIFRG
jgi:protein-S-isoprenylcysteine O-methyltransferase Ste14